MTELTDRVSRLSEPHRALLERMNAPAGQREGLFPATAAQRSLWFTDQLTPGTSTYNIPALLRLRGRLDHSLLAGALQGLVDEHEALRTTLVAVEGSPLQHVRAAREQQLTVIDAVARPEPDVIAEAIEDAHQPFDLAAGPLMRATLWILGPDDHLLLVVLHHSMADGWSLGVLLDDLAAALDGGGRAGTGPAAAAHPVDLALLEAATAHDGQSDNHQSAAFWTERLAGASPPLLPQREAEPAGAACGTLRLPLAAGAAGQVRELARRRGVTEYAVYFAALAAVCHRVAGQSDLVLGASFARRSGRGLERTVGLLVNALPVRLAWPGDPAFGELVTLAGQALRSSMANGGVPLERIIQGSATRRAGDRTPFLDVVFALNRDPLPARRVGGCAVERVPVPPRTAKFPLLVSVDFEGQRAHLGCEYDRGLLDDGFVAGLARMVKHLLEHIADAAATALGEVRLHSAEEEAATARLAHGPAPRDVPGGPGFGAVVAAIARQAPRRTALVEGDRQVSYGELVTAADSLAAALRARGAGQDTPVAVALPRGIDQITACLAVIRAGHHYLPLDPANPAARNRYMLAEAGARLLVTDAGHGEGLDIPGLEVLRLRHHGAQGAGQPAPPAQPPGRDDDLALVGYTSGSTGHPKGFAITQRGIARLLGDHRYLPPDPARVFLIANAVTFDASTWEIWNTLLSGARGVVVPRYGYTAHGLADLIRAHGATAAHVTTQLFNEIIDEDPDTFAPLTELVIGGEALSAEHVRRARKCLPGTRLLNAYGPAECSVMATMAELELPPPGARRVPIGGPLAGTEVYLLDHGMRPVPAGAIGELYIGGSGVARGYVGQPGLTAERFVPSPFTPGERLYRTGDLARADAGGSLVYLGRADQQLKIRGFRVEPGEIESRLTQHPAVAEAAVTLSSVAGAPALVAYVVAAGAELSTAQVREFLRADLPEYMVPSAVVTLDRLPLTQNGKIDRGALPEPAPPRGRAQRTGPRSPLEQTVLDVWAAVLGRSADTISVHDDFFATGGHSLLASRAAARLERQTGQPVPLRLMFDHPTVAGLAGALARTPGPGGGPVLAPVLAPVPRRGRLPLSFAQERLWFLHQMAPDVPLYNLPLALRLTGRLRVDLLHRALTLVTARHEALRTVFAADTGGAPYQRVLDEPEIPLSVVRLPGAMAERQRLAGHVIRQAALAPFDLASDLPIRASVAEIGPREHILLVTVHHIVCDGWSTRLLADEVSAAYAALLGGGEPGWAELGVQYGDFAVWQRERLSGEVLEGELAHWGRVLAGAPAVLELPADHPRPPVFRYRGAGVPVALGAEVTAALRRLAAEHRVTPFMVLVAALAVVLGRYAGQDDVVIGTPVAGRPDPLVEDLIGFFANTLVLRVDVSGDPTVGELLERVRSVCLDAYGHQEVPFERLVEHLAPARDLSRTPVFQVMLALQNEPLSQVTLPGLDAVPYPVDNPSARCDLTVLLREGTAAISGVLEYNSDVFEPETAGRLSRQLAATVEGLVSGGGERPAGAGVVSAEELAWLAEVGSGPVPEAGAGLVPQVLARWAAATPDVVAVRGTAAPGVLAGGGGGEEALTYGGLLGRASQVAAGLAAAGVRRGDVVGVLLDRVPLMAAAVLGVWWAGAAFVPLDPGFPEGRLQLMAADAGVRAVLTSAGLAGRAPGPVTVLVEDLPSGDGFTPVRVTSPDRAYVLYTSGSTGRPKGVVISHGALANLLRAVASRPGLAAADRLVAVTTFSFDMGVLELLGPLAAGGQVVIASAEQARDPHLLAELIEAAGATVVQATPATWRMLVTSGWLGRWDHGRGPLRIISGGEALPATLAADLLAAGHELWNGYGPTETTVYSAIAQITSPAGITIGRPVAGTQIQILDATLRPVPAGAAGEIFIGGTGVADGYLGQPALTAERFLPAARGQRIYRTGDLGRWDHHGQLIYLGRTDHQLKIRGYRVEPGEIETALARHPAVAEAVVTAPRGDLTAFIVPSGPTPPTPAELRQHLHTTLPDYMIPAAIVTLGHLPLTSNGKIDRSALADLALAEPLPQPSPGRVPPRSAFERAVVDVWATVLGRGADTISVHDDFFDLGGHSLLAARVAGHLSAALGRRPSLRLVFENPTAEGLAAALSGTAEDRGPALAPAARRGSLPLSFAQERLWFLHQMDPAAALYNVPLAVRLTGGLRVDLLHRALLLVAGRHEVLRTVFADENGRPYQQVGPPRITLGVVSVASEEMARQVLRQAGYAPFSLTSSPPVRATLVRLGGEEHILLVTVHHIVCDGWSTRLLADEVSAAYAALLGGGEPGWAELGVQYGDFAVWQRERLGGEVLEGELAHWGRVLAGAPAVLELPADHPRPPVFRYRGAGVPVALGAEVTAALRRLAAEHRVTPFMVLVAALAVVLGRYAGQDDVVIGTPVAGRPDPLVEDLIGFFANTLVLRVDVSGDPTVGELLERVRSVCLDAYGHQEVPFERLVEHLAPARDLSRTPVFQVMLALQNEPLSQVTLPGLDVTVHAVENPTAKYDLVFTLRDGAPGISGVLEYNSDLFEPETVLEIRESLLHVLGAMAEGPDRDIQDLPLREAAATRELLTGWNLTPRYDPDTCLHDLVARQVAATPDAIAVICDEPGQTLTYRELDRRAGQVTRLLRGQGVGPDDLVAVLLPRSAGLVASLLGVLRCGAGFLPLDPGHPADRVRAILADAGVAATITTAELRDLVPGGGLLGPSPAGPGPGDPAPGGPDPDGPGVDASGAGAASAGAPGSLAYAIYTSGSTGRPKGVLIEHHAICGNLQWMQQDWPLDAHDRVLQKTTIAFDVAVKEIFWPLLSGAAVVLARPGGQRDAEYLIDLIDRHGITVAHFVPSMLEAALSHAERTGRVFGASLEKVMAGAETLPASTLRRFFAATDAELLHMYGPTETAIAVTGWTCPRDRVPARVPLGRPMPGVQLYVLDPGLRPVPRGAWGELYVGGTCVGRGYLGQPAETAAAFVPDPFSGVPAARLYRTGDMVRINHERLLEFRGRLDDQVKVRGFRIELGEVEAAMTRHPGVRQAAVVARRSPGSGAQRLAGYVSASPDLTEEALRDHLRTCLPDYMIPSWLAILPGLPLNANGKIDRGQLPAPGPRPPAAGGSGTPGEQAVADVLAAVLERDGIGPDDDLFALGGHSLQVPQIAALIAERTGVEVALREIFLDPTVAGIARAVERAGAAPVPAIPRVDRAARRRPARTS